jgi:uncharacterized RDD family membrane protein YckC
VRRLPRAGDQPVSTRPPGRPGLIHRVISQPVTSVADFFVPTIVDAVDIDETLGRVDVDELLTHIDLDAVVDRIDLQALIEKLDLNRVLDKVDLDALIQRIGMDQLLDRIDLNTLLEHVDLNQLLERVDLNAVVARVDINAIVDDVDISAFTGKISSAVTKGTESFLRSMLDLVRRQLVGLDLVILRFTDGLLRRQPDSLPLGPTLLVPSGDTDASPQVSGRYAGPVSRLLAFGIDVFLIFAGFALGTSILNYLIRLVSGYNLERNSTNGPWWAIVLAIWAFVYLWIGPSIAGRTLGMSLVGLRVVSNDGSAISQRQSFIRVLTLPLSVVLLGVGLLMAVFGERRKALHDHFGRTCVVYDWGERPAEMPAPLTQWLAGRGAIEIEVPPK